MHAWHLQLAFHRGNRFSVRNRGNAQRPAIGAGRRLFGCGLGRELRLGGGFGLRLGYQLGSRCGIRRRCRRLRFRLRLRLFRGRSDLLHRLRYTYRDADRGLPSTTSRLQRCEQLGLTHGRRTAQAHLLGKLPELRQLHILKILAHCLMLPFCGFYRRFAGELYDKMREKTAMKRSIITVFGPNRTSFTVQRSCDRRNTPLPRDASRSHASPDSLPPSDVSPFRCSTAPGRQEHKARRPDDGTTGRTAKFATRRYFCSW